MGKGRKTKKGAEAVPALALSAFPAIPRFALPMRVFAGPAAVIDLTKQNCYNYRVPVYCLTLMAFMRKD